MDELRKDGDIEGCPDFSAEGSLDDATVGSRDASKEGELEPT